MVDMDTVTNVLKNVIIKFETNNATPSKKHIQKLSSQKLIKNRVFFFNNI